ncbi:MAG: tol-pal system protein YbgF [Deltaproteobacteria bacterium]|nr:tol-pal system protein YbgF [Deltaproteobacteria bacterium]
MTRKPVCLFGVAVCCLLLLLAGIAGASAGGDYQKGRSLYLEKKYGEAARNFQDFILKYPTDRLVSNAQYWLGECYYGLAEHAKAAKAFKKVFAKYPRSSKAADAMLKRAYSLSRLGKYRQAESQRKYVVDRYPDSAAAKKVGETASAFASRAKASPRTAVEKNQIKSSPMLPEERAVQAVLESMKALADKIGKDTRNRTLNKSSAARPVETPINMADIMQAIREGDTAKARTILDQHPYVVEYRDRERNTPLHLAAALDRVDMAGLLLARDADVNADSGNYVFVYTPLHEAARHNSPRVAKLLISKGADINAGRYIRNREWAGRYTYTPLFHAVRFNHLELAKVLLENGADPNISTHPSTGGTALRLARSKGYVELAKLLMEYDAVH